MNLVLDDGHTVATLATEGPGNADTLGHRLPKPSAQNTGF